MATRRKSEAKPSHLLRYRRGIPGDYTQRDQAIYARRAEGISFTQIGLEHGLSRERVRQIVGNQERKKRFAPLKAAFANWPK